MAAVRVVLPQHLRTLGRLSNEVQVNVDRPATISTILDALEHDYPVLRGTIREHESRRRRTLVRFFVCGEDISHQPADAPLPDAVATGSEPVFIIGAIAGG